MTKGKKWVWNTSMLKRIFTKDNGRVRPWLFCVAGVLTGFGLYVAAYTVFPEPEPQPSKELQIVPNDIMMTLDKEDPVEAPQEAPEPEPVTELNAEIAAEPVSDDYVQYQEYVQSYGVATWDAAGDAAAFQQMGVMSYNDWRVTYYNPVTLGTSHDALGGYTVGQGIANRGDGIGVTSDGYIAVAMPADVPYGTIVDTPFGPGMCVDHSGGAMDVVVYF